MKKWLRIIIRILAVTVGIFLVLWITLYVYFRTHKREILDKTIAAVQKNISGTIIIDDIGLYFPSTFPYLSVAAENVVIRDSLFVQHKHELLRAKSLYLQINPFALLSGKFTISRIIVEDGNIYIFENGNYSNLHVFKKTEPGTDKKQQEIDIAKIRMVNVRLVFDKKSFNKFYDIKLINTVCKIDKNPERVEVQLNLDAFANTIAFNTNKGSFAEKKTIAGNFKLTFLNASETLAADNVVLKIDKDPYRFSGTFAFSGERKFHLEINAAKANYSKAVQLLPLKIKRNIDSIFLDKPLYVKAVVDGLLIPQNQAAVRVEWSTKNAQIQTSYGIFEQTSFSGSFNNKVDDTLSAGPENSKIELENLTGKWKEIAIDAKMISITNLLKPTLQCDLNALANLSALNNVAAPETFHFKQGALKVDIKYNGPIYDSATIAPVINGFARITDGELLYGPREIQFEQFNGEVIFSGTDVLLKNISTTVAGNQLNMNIRGDNLLTLMNSDPSKAVLKVAVSSPLIDIGNFTSFIGSRKKTANSAKNSSFKKAANRIDNLLELCSIELALDAKRIKFRRFTAAHVSSSIKLTNLTWSIFNTSFRHAGGLVKFDGKLTGGNKNYNPFTFNATVADLDISKVFYAFDNFKISSLNEKNLKGKLYSNIHLKGAIVEKAELVPSSLKGDIYLSLKHGALINFEPLANMSVFLLKNRDFSSINFSEINNRLDINGSMISVNRMEIQSTVLSLFMEGLYDVSGKATDLQVQVPLSNLKKRDPNQAPTKMGTKKGAGISVYVNAKSNKKGDIDLSYSLFNKKNKKK